MIGRRLGDFEIIEEIGRGGMGQVYRARQISLDRDVAIKILPGDLGDMEEFRERFDVEAKAVASLVHENILQMYSKGVTDDGVHYFAMEYVDGEDLGGMLKRGVVFSESQAVGIVVQICRGLEAAWRKNIIHRDIKPGNIIVTKTGTVKIADFGLAKSLDATRKLTQTNMYMGTVAYISPEQGEGKQLDYRTDIYSLGVVFFQLLTGSVPFKAETPSSVIYKHVYEAPPPPRSINPSVSREAEAIVLKAIAKKPEDRFQNPVEFREALESLGKPGAGKEEEAAKQEAFPEGRPHAAAAGNTGRGRRVVLTAAILVLVMLCGSGIYASIYGYHALLSKVFPSKATVSQVSDPAQPNPSPAVPSPVAAAAEEASGPAVKHTQKPQVTAGVSPVAPEKQAGKAVDTSGRQKAHPDGGDSPSEQRPASKRPSLPTVMLVASGEPNIADIIESVIDKKLLAEAIPLAASGERNRTKADVLVYVTISTMNAAPLEFYGHTAEQYSSTIYMKVVDAATNKVVASPRPKTVNYTTLNMQDNIEEAAEQMVSGLPGKIKTFWKSGVGS